MTITSTEPCLLLAIASSNIFEISVETRVSSSICTSFSMVYTGTGLPVEVGLGRDGAVASILGSIVELFGRLGREAGGILLLADEGPSTLF